MRIAGRRIRCAGCGASSHEPIAFCPDPYVRYTKWAARFVLALRAEMSISPVAKFTGLHWETVKNIEKDGLEKKYKRVRLDDVAYLGIDEVYLGKRLGYITVVRDLDSGAVLFIGKGTGGKRFLLLRNEESLSEESKKELGTLRERFEDLGTASAMKEYLRTIHRIAPGASIARLAFEKWCAMAVESGIACLKTMAKTIRQRIDGLLAYWNHGCLTSASQEGFNNMIGSE